MTPFPKKKRDFWPGRWHGFNHDLHRPHAASTVEMRNPTWCDLTSWVPKNRSFTEIVWPIFYISLLETFCLYTSDFSGWLLLIFQDMLEFSYHSLWSQRGCGSSEPRELGKQIKSLLPQEAKLKQHKTQAAKDSLGSSLVGGFKYFTFSPLKLGKISNLTNIFQMGWNQIKFFCESILWTLQVMVMFD